MSELVQAYLSLDPRAREIVVTAALDSNDARGLGLAGCYLGTQDPRALKLFLADLRSYYPGCPPSFLKKRAEGQRGDR